MYRIAEGHTQGLKDVERFIAFLNDPPSELQGFFTDQNDIFIARAPGRLDVMGGVADYSGSLVLEMPIAEATIAAVQKNDDRKIVIKSRLSGAQDYVHFEIDLSDLIDLTHDDAR